MKVPAEVNLSPRLYWNRASLLSRKEGDSRNGNLTGKNPRSLQPLTRDPSELQKRSGRNPEKERIAQRAEA